MPHAKARVRVFAGPNGSGKSTIRDVLREEWIGVYVNADEMEKTLRRTGAVDLAEFGLAGEASPVPSGRLRDFLARHTLLEKIGRIHLAKLARLDGAFVRFPADHIDSYLASVMADFVRRELLEAGVSFTFETVMCPIGTRSTS